MPASDLSLIPDTLVTPAPPKLPVRKPLNMATDLRSFGDSISTRHAIYDNVMDAASKIQPFTNGTHTIKLSNLQYVDPDRYTRKQRKDAILGGQTLARRLRGTWELHDNATGNVLEKLDRVVARVPYLSSLGTFTHRGNEYTVNNQPRLLPGVFTRIKENGELESHANILPGKGISHRYFLDPEKGVFKMRLGQAEVPLLPVMRLLGATDKELNDAWGPELLAANYKQNSGQALTKLQNKLLSFKDKEDPDEGNQRQSLIRILSNMEVDPEVTQRTLGQPYDRIDKSAMLAITKKLLAVNQGKAEVDDRDHLAYQTFVGPEDLFRERIARDHGHIQRSAFQKALRMGTLAKLPSGLMTPQLEQVLLGSGLGQSIEEINPAEVFDKQARATRLGEGGIPSVDAIPDEARGVQPSHLAFMDPIRTPESFRVGIDTYVSSAAKKGKDGRIYAPFTDYKTGQQAWKSPQDLLDANVTTTDSLKWQTDRVPVMKGGKLDYVPKSEIDYVVPHFEQIFSPLGNLIPLKSASKPNRIAMGSRYITQALPIVSPEAPLVRGAMPGKTTSYEEEYGPQMGAIRASNGGRVLSTDNGVIKVRYDNGKTDDLDLYQMHPFNRKTFFHQTPTVQAGQTFKPNDLLAHSNYTDKKGAMALGTNARVAYIPWHGLNFEDANVVSESYAKRMSSEHMYQHDIEITPQHRLGKKHFISFFPQKFDKKALESLDDQGVVRPGQKIQYGDPLILAAREKDRAMNKVHKKRQPGFNDETVLWKHHDPGEVVDVRWNKGGPIVTVKSVVPMQVGDKLSGRYGDKGVIADIIPDHKMPHDEAGRPFEVLLNPLGIISRTNPSQKLEAWLGAVAEKTGKPINVPDFEEIEDLTAWTEKKMKEVGLSSQGIAIDPSTGRKIPAIAAGTRHLMKLYHTAESKGQGRGTGGYTMEGSPAKGGESGSKRVSMLDTNALLSHGATETLNDAHLVRGQNNPDYWLQFMQGYTPKEPKEPLVYQKFLHSLKASGINVVRDGSQIHVMALTPKDVDHLAGDRMIRSGDTVNFDKELRPVPGGLFDPQLTGGHNGTRWSAIKLHEPMPNPVMEEPIRRILGLTQNKYEDVLAGKEDLPKYGSGPSAISKALKAVDLPRDIAFNRAQLKASSRVARDIATRRLGYLKFAQEKGIHPSEWVLDKVPVLPPVFRPVSMLGSSKMPLVSDANYLYRELMHANENLKDMTGEVGEENIGNERLALYHSFKAITGLADPVHPKLQEKNVKGILKSVFGESPKYGMMQRKLLSTTVDNVGRAVIIPNPDYDMDTVGIPETKAFDIYGKFLVRSLRRRGMQIKDALHHVKEKSDLARDMLLKEMEDRPVYINRAPVLHKFGIMAFRPRLVKGDVLQVSPLIVKGFNADFDGDAMQFHVPTGEKAVKEAYERMLPSRNLLSLTDFKTPMHQPGQEYLAGLYHGTANNSGKRPRVFATMEDARRAYANNEISADDPVEILRH